MSAEGLVLAQENGIKADSMQQTYGSMDFKTADINSFQFESPINSLIKSQKYIQKCIEGLEDYFTKIQQSDTFKQQMDHYTTYLETMKGKGLAELKSQCTDDLITQIEQQQALVPIYKVPDDNSEPEIQNFQNADQPLVEPHESLSRLPDETTINIFEQQTKIFVQYLLNLISGGKTLRCELIRNLAKELGVDELETSLNISLPRSADTKDIQKYLNQPNSTNQQNDLQKLQEPESQEEIQIHTPEQFQIQYNIFRSLEYLAEKRDSKIYRNNYHLQDQIEKLIYGMRRRTIQETEDFKAMELVLPFSEFLDVRFIFNMDRVVLDGYCEIYNKIFKGVEKRLQRVEASSNSVIISNANEIILHQTVSVNQQFVDSQLSVVKSPNNDVDILCSYLDMHLLGQLPARSMFLQSWYDSLTLVFPENLITASLLKTKIENLNQCINLMNLNSEGNVYAYNDICSLNLTRIYSKRDLYKGRDEAECMLNVLFQQSALQYVSVHNGHNIVNSQSLQGNISGLRFFQHTSYREIQFTIYAEQLMNNDWIPFQLRYFNNCYYDEENSRMKLSKLNVLYNQTTKIENWVHNKIEYDIHAQKRVIRKVGCE